MKTVVIAERKVANFDKWLVAYLELVESDEDVVRHARKLIGIRNEKGELYRAIAASGLNQFLETYVVLNDFGFSAQAYNSFKADEYIYDAIFNADSSVVNAGDICQLASAQHAEQIE